MMRIPFETMCTQFERVLESRNMEKEEAALCARLIAETSLEGVYTHGANRFATLVKGIDEKRVDVHAHAQRTGSFGVLERWDGKSGVGNLNAYSCMNRAIELAKEHTIGCVALKHTNHWMRPGTYGLMAAEEGCIAMLWTNTTPLMSPWGGADTKVGNNPLVLAIPSKKGPILVDMAMSLFSYGKLETYVREKKELPVPGGWDERGELTTNAESILRSKRSLPIGFWKGTSLAIALDLIAATLSGGRTTRSIGSLPEEGEVSQVFLVFDISKFPDREQLLDEIQATLEDLKESTPLDAEKPVRYPGQFREQTRRENLEKGIPVDEAVWNTILAL
ncbi:MAG: 3-dehydro-L-gulonate 2-dehydrogenase [Sphaerochaeta sp.]|nr:3-dehydro-L-gulonate 2-dehydrogenase [Sphaerochaeta sp.]